MPVVTFGSSSAPTAVTGTLQDVTGQPLQNGSVLITLANYGTSVPRVLGTAALVNPSVMAQADKNGNIAINVWGNDQIDPAGTYYFIAFRDSAGNTVSAYRFKITGTGFNLNSATPF